MISIINSNFVEVAYSAYMLAHHATLDQKPSQHQGRLSLFYYIREFVHLVYGRVAVHESKLMIWDYISFFNDWF